MPIEQAITEYRFPFGANRTSIQMEPPPNTAALAVASQPIAFFLEKAFARNAVGGSRPTAVEWFTVLERLERQLKQCHVNASHHYLNGLQSCPWCHIEAATGVILFNAYIHNPGSGTSTFDIAAVWGRITAVQHPGPSPALFDRQHFGSIRACKEAICAGGRPLVRKLRIILVIAAVIGLCWALPEVSILWIIGGLFIGNVIGAKKTNDPAIASFTEKYSIAQAKYRVVREQWDREAGDAKFTAKLRELDGYKTQWRDHQNVRQRNYRKLEREREKAQLQCFLDRFAIDRATIPGIGPGRKSMLESYNVETAWDITDHNLLRVPGFGPALRGKLTEWRRSVERKFRFDPTKGVDPRDIAALDRDMADIKRKLEQHLMSGASELTQIRDQILIHRKLLEPQVNDVFRNMLQAEADMNAARA